MKLHTYTQEYYSAIKKNEILPFVTTWTDFKGLTLDQITQKERQIPQDLSYMQNLKQAKTPLQPSSQITQNRLVVDSGCGDGRNG